MTRATSPTPNTLSCNAQQYLHEKLTIDSSEAVRHGVVLDATVLRWLRGSDPTARTSSGHVQKEFHQRITFNLECGFKH